MFNFNPKLKKHPHAKVSRPSNSTFWLLYYYYYFFGSLISAVENVFIILAFIREMNRRCVTNQIHWQYFSRVAGSSISMS